MHTRLAQHGVVLELRLAQRRAVAGDEDKLGLALADRLECRLVAERILARLHNESQTAVDGFNALFLRIARASEINKRTWANNENNASIVCTYRLLGHHSENSSCDGRKQR